MEKTSGDRIERDSLGEVRIPGGRLYGASTQRAVENFPISGIRLPRIFIRALGICKHAAARVNGELGLLDAARARAICEAAAEVADGRYDDHFPVDVFQTGSGTSTHTNANEVIANLAAIKLGGKPGDRDRVHPNDHVNLGQSSNDVFPSAIHVAATLGIHESLRPAMESLGEGLRSKAAEFRDVVKIGRTHLQDAVPLTLGQEFGGYAAQVAACVERLDSVAPRLRQLAIGGTAVGTGLNTHPEFGRRAAAAISELAGCAFVEAGNHFEAQACRDTCLEASGALRVLAVALDKIAGDIRWLASGPRAGLGELTLPAVQPGSSMMPGKVNPVIPEMAIQACAQAIANDTAVALGAAGGRFELNMMMPLIAHNLLQSIALLAGACRVFRSRCLDGLQANRERCAELAERSLSLVTAVAPIIGYDRAAAAALEAHRSGRTLREVLLEKGLIPADRLDEILDPRRMV